MSQGTLRNILKLLDHKLGYISFFSSKARCSNFSHPHLSTLNMAENADWVGVSHVNTIWLLRGGSFIMQGLSRLIVTSTHPADFFPHAQGDKESTFSEFYTKLEDQNCLSFWNFLWNEKKKLSSSVKFHKQKDLVLQKCVATWYL